MDSITLAGSGTISAGDVIEVGGTIAPGPVATNAAGSGVLTLGSGEMTLAGTFDVQVGVRLPAAQSDSRRLRKRSHRH